MLTEEEHRDYVSFALASPSISLQKGKKGKTSLWKVSQENPNFYSQAQQAQQHNNMTITNQTQPIRTQTQAPFIQNPAQVQVQAQAQLARLAQAQPPQLGRAPAQLPQPHAAVPILV